MTVVIILTSKHIEIHIQTYFECVDLSTILYFDAQFVFFFLLNIRNGFWVLECFVLVDSPSPSSFLWRYGSDFWDSLSCLLIQNLIHCWDSCLVYLLYLNNPTTWLSGLVTYNTADYCLQHRWVIRCVWRSWSRWRHARGWTKVEPLPLSKGLVSPNISNWLIFSRSDNIYCTAAYSFVGATHADFYLVAQLCELSRNV